MIKYTYILKVFRKFYFHIYRTKQPLTPKCDKNPDSAAQNIYEALTADEPCMIARFGSTEMACLCNYIGIKSQNNRYFDYIKGVTQPWWWESTIINQMQQWSGFFPPRKAYLERFCELMLADLSQVDVLGSWLPQENLFETELMNCKKVNLELLNPYFSRNPWTNALEGKKILVVHPFAKTIEQQYKKRELLFENDILPEFELMTIKAVQSIAGNPTNFSDWFEALDYMKSEIDKCNYDICLIGCGAYGFPLAAHVKRMGKKGFQLGGALQLLFGIRGKRWESEGYNSQYNYARLMNEHWVKPSDEDTPEKAANVEGGCYW